MLLAAPEGLAATALTPQKVMQLEVEGKINVSDLLSGNLRPARPVACTETAGVRLGTSGCHRKQLGDPPAFRLVNVEACATASRTIATREGARRSARTDVMLRSPASRRD